MKKWNICLVLILLLVVLPAAGYTATHKSTTDIRKYREWDTHDLHGKLYVFPQNMESADAEEYLYKFSEGLLDSNYQIYLKSQYSKDKYQKEIERLSRITDEYKGEETKIVYDIERFQMPSYVSVYNFDSTCEYALLDEEHSVIHYIYLQFTDKNQVKFDKNLLPDSYYRAEPDGGFSIYAHELEACEGWMTGKADFFR